MTTAVLIFAALVLAVFAVVFLVASGSASHEKDGEATAWTAIGGLVALVASLVVAFVAGAA